jgi:hypothetical protein
MDSNHPRRLYESRVLPTELASHVFPRKLAGRAGFEPAHGVINSHVPFQLGYRPKYEGPDFWSGPSRIESELGNLTNGQTNPEGPARLTRRLIMDLVCIVIFEIEYSMPSAPVPGLSNSLTHRPLFHRTAVSHVLEIDIADYFPSALAPSSHQRVLLSAGDNPAVARS